ncbi:MAG: hypothetical protein ACE5GX_13815 [Thermoanaerobaculia bacterium]
MTRKINHDSDRVRGALFTALLVMAVAAFAASPAEAQAWSLSGSASSDIRWFLDTAAHPGQLDGQQGSLVLAPEWLWRSEDRRHQLKVAPFARWDGEDEERSHFDLREGFYRYSGDGWDLLAGAARVFWGVAESRHLVDVINQTDAVEDIDEEDKLGQPMLRVGVTRGWGRLELYSLLGFRERTFAGVDGRLRAPFVADDGRAVYESGAEEEHVDWAVRWSNAIGDWDVGAHVFHGTAREPRFIVEPGGNDALVPLYEQVEQVGIDIQYTRNAWLYKLEGLARRGQGGSFGAAVAGGEYTLYQLVGAADLGLIGELHWDDRDPVSGAAGTPRVNPTSTLLAPTIYDRDIFLGARLALNDIQDTSILVGALVDHDDRSTAVFVEAERRVATRVTAEIEGRFFTNVDPTGDLAAVERDDVFTVRLAWNF